MGSQSENAGGGYDCNGPCNPGKSALPNPGHGFRVNSAGTVELGHTGRNDAPTGAPCCHAGPSPVVLPLELFLNK